MAAWPELQEGDVGGWVGYVHRMLRTSGKDVSSEEGSFSEPGTYGSTTAEAVREFQTAQGLEATGKTDRATWEKLVSLHGGSEAGEMDIASDMTVHGSQIYWEEYNKGGQVVAPNSHSDRIVITPDASETAVFDQTIQCPTEEIPPSMKVWCHVDLPSLQDGKYWFHYSTHNGNKSQTQKASMRGGTMILHGWGDWA